MVRTVIPAVREEALVLEGDKVEVVEERL